MFTVKHTMFDEQDNRFELEVEVCITTLGCGAGRVDDGWPPGMHILAISVESCTTTVLGLPHDVKPHKEHGWSKFTDWAIDELQSNGDFHIKAIAEAERQGEQTTLGSCQ